MPLIMLFYMEMIGEKSSRLEKALMFLPPVALFLIFSVVRFESTDYFFDNSLPFHAGFTLNIGRKGSMGWSVTEMVCLVQGMWGMLRAWYDYRHYGDADHRTDAINETIVAFGGVMLAEVVIALVGCETWKTVPQYALLASCYTAAAYCWGLFTMRLCAENRRFMYFPTKEDEAILAAALKEEERMAAAAAAAGADNAYDKDENLTATADGGNGTPDSAKADNASAGTAAADDAEALANGPAANGTATANSNTADVQGLSDNVSGTEGIAANDSGNSSSAQNGMLQTAEVSAGNATADGKPDVDDLTEDELTAGLVPQQIYSTGIDADVLAAAKAAETANIADIEETEALSHMDVLELELKTLVEQEKIFLQAGIKIDDVALTLGTNRTYCSKLMKRVYGHTFNEQMNILRIESAKADILARPEVSVESIALSNGYNSSNAFNRVFSQIVGTTPAVWRQEHAKPTRKNS